MPEMGAPPARVLFSSSFLDPTRQGHGGNRRAQQLFDLLTADGITVARATSQRDAVAAALRRVNWGTVADFARHLKIGPLRRARGAARFARNYADWRRGIALHPAVRVLVWEDTMNVHTLRAAKDAGLRVVAVPQNLESLVPGKGQDRIGQSLPWWLEHEIEALGSADRVFAISREEQWLLRLRGIDAAYLPFFPDLVQRERWLKLRSLRAAPFDRYVVLGTAFNPPTKAGMHELLSWMNSMERSNRLPVHVVGYGTEALRDLQCEGITIHGGLDDADLEAHLARARAVVLYQRAAVGALIRVSEMLLAGIPVIASGIAARSTAQYRGVTVFESFAELASLLARESWDVPPIPEAPEQLERTFVNTVSEWSV